MAIDTGIVDPSNCILLDPGGAAWWLSNAVFMEGPDKSTANPGPNTTDVVVTWKAGSSPDNPCQLQIPTVLLELYVGDPHDERVDAAARVTGEEAQRNAEDHGKRHRGEADGERGGS